MPTSITRRPPDDTAQRIAGAKACIEALKAVERDANNVVPTLDDRDCEAFYDHQAAAGAQLAASLGPLTPRQEGAVRALVEYIHSNHTTGIPNLDKWAPIVGMTAEELAASIGEVRTMVAMDEEGEAMATSSSQEDDEPAPTTESTPFSKFSGKEIFTVADGLPVADALEHASYFLSLAESLLTCDPDDLHSDQVFACRHMIEMGKALVDASSGRA